MRLGQYLQLGSKMKAARIESGMSQSDMAKKLGMSGSAYSNYENGYSEPPVETIEQYCGILGISMSQLLEVKLPSNGLAPIRRYADFLRVIKDLKELGVPIEVTNDKRESDNELIVNISLRDPIMYGMVNGYINLNTQLEKDAIDKEEYDMELEDTLLKFDIPIQPRT